MTAFEFDISPKDAAGVFAVDRVNESVLRAVGARLKSSKITKSEIAKRLGVDKSTVSRLLRGNQNITARSLGELLWALDFDFDLVLRDLLEQRHNHGSIHEAAQDQEQAPNKVIVRGCSSDKRTISFSRGAFVHKYEPEPAA